MSARPEPPATTAVVYNPTKVTVDRLKASVAKVDKSLDADDWWWLPTTPEDAGQNLTRRALAAGATEVIAAGGDGTVRAVAEALRGTAVPMGVVAVGTGNLLARNLLLPLGNTEAALRVALTGAQREIDVGVATLTRPGGRTEEHIFLVMAGLGLDAAMIAHTSDALKHRLGWVAYVEGGLRALPRMGKTRLRYTLAGHAERRADVGAVIVANSGSLPGHLMLFPETSLDDGLLDIAIAQPKSLLGWLLIWRTVTWENPVLRRSSLGRSIIKVTSRADNNTLAYLRGEAIRLSVDDPQPFEIDGDDFGTVTDAALRVDSRALVVRVAAEG